LRFRWYLRNSYCLLWYIVICHVELQSWYPELKDFGKNKTQTTRGFAA
jgi:hypothetical protein